MLPFARGPPGGRQLSARRLRQASATSRCPPAGRVARLPRQRRPLRRCGRDRPCRGRTSSSPSSARPAAASPRCSTLAAGLLPPCIRRDPRARTRASPASTSAAGYLFQQDAVMPWKTARDNVAIGLEVAGVARAGGARAGAGLAQARRASQPSATAIPTSSRAGRGSASASPRC